MVLYTASAAFIASKMDAAIVSWLFHEAPTSVITHAYYIIFPHRHGHTLAASFDTIRCFFTLDAIKRYFENILISRLDTPCTVTAFLSISEIFELDGNGPGLMPSKSIGRYEADAAHNISAPSFTK